MMNYILIDTNVRQQLLPFTHTRPVADIRCGILTMRARWELILSSATSSLCPAYMQDVFPILKEAHNIYINAAIFANHTVVAAINQLQLGQKLVTGNTLIAFCTTDKLEISVSNYTEVIADFETISFHSEIMVLANVWDVFMLNEKAIRDDFDLLTTGRTSQAIPYYVSCIAPENIFIEERAVVGPCIINASTGPVYVAANAEVMEGCMLRGPISLGENATLKMGAKVYGATTIGPGCKVGGEVSNTVFFANSNKGHDGFIGNAVIGEWCNLGADTNSSNLKNNYDKVKIWSEDQGNLIDTGLQFCGLIMADHSKTGINTMFNTATVVGVSCNIFGSSFPEKYIPSFTWGGASDSSIYSFDKAMETAARMMERRGIQLTTQQMEMYQYLFDQQKTIINNISNKKRRIIMRKKIVAGNWKMNLNLGEGYDLVAEILSKLPSLSESQQVIIAPPFLHLQQTITQTQYTAFVSVASQTCHHESEGAFTGEVSAPMLKDAGVRYAIIGHSERRAYNNEDNALLAQKTNAALAAGLSVIFCCGEDLAIRDANTQNGFVATQLKESLFHLDAKSMSKIVIAYEPIWAIGTGRTATAQQAQDMHQHIRTVIEQQFGGEAADNTSILYGGSCKATNAKEIFAGADVDGGLIGGAALIADDFIGIIKAMIADK